MGQKVIVSNDGFFSLFRPTMCLRCIQKLVKSTTGRPRTSYLAYIQQLLGYEKGSIQADLIATLAEDRSAWRSLDL